MRRTTRQGRELLKLMAQGAELMARSGVCGPIKVTYGSTRRGRPKTFDIHPRFQMCIGCGKSEGKIPLAYGGRICADCKEHGLFRGQTGGVLTALGSAGVQRSGRYVVPVRSIVEAIMAGGEAVDLRVVRVSDGE